MKRDSKKEFSNGVVCDTMNVANVRSSMIGEIENRSSHLIGIKEDVETQGEFVNFLIKEVNKVVFQDIEDVVAFVKWLDDELCFLVDERAVLTYFNWLEKKADTLREADFGYRDLKKLEYEVSNYNDDTRVPCDLALKKMIKFGSIKLAKKYMKRVATELHTKGTSEKDSSMDYMLLQGVRFAFRIHQAVMDSSSLVIEDKAVIVMRYMKDIIEGKEMEFISKWAPKNRKSSYTEEELDVVRCEVLDYIQGFV